MTKEETYNFKSRISSIVGNVNIVLLAIDRTTKPWYCINKNINSWMTLSIISLNCISKMLISYRGYPLNTTELTMKCIIIDSNRL